MEVMSKIIIFILQINTFKKVTIAIVNDKNCYLNYESMLKIIHFELRDVPGISICKFYHDWNVRYKLCLVWWIPHQIITESTCWLNMTSESYLLMLCSQQLDIVIVNTELVVFVLYICNKNIVCSQTFTKRQ